MYPYPTSRYELVNIYNRTLASHPSTIQTLHNKLTEFYSCQPGECSRL